jgi:hypothetical protein
MTWNWQLPEKTALPSPRLDKGSVDGGIYKNPSTGLELTPGLKSEKSSYRLA